MRVTQMMRNYIHSLVMAKVQGKFDAAEAAAMKLDAKNRAAMQEVTAYANSLLPELTKKVAAFAAKKGLTWLDHRYAYDGTPYQHTNYAFAECVSDCGNYVETSVNCKQDKFAKCRAEDEIRNEPQRIKDAVDRAVASICFDLELGKTKKAELEELIKGYEVKL